MRMNRSVTAAEIVEARRLIARSRHGDGARPASEQQAQAPEQGAAHASSAASTHEEWHQTEWSETTFEPRS